MYRYPHLFHMLIALTLLCITSTLTAGCTSGRQVAVTPRHDGLHMSADELEDRRDDLAKTWFAPRSVTREPQSAEVDAPSSAAPAVAELQVKPAQDASDVMVQERDVAVSDTVSELAEDVERSAEAETQQAPPLRAEPLPVLVSAGPESEEAGIVTIVEEFVIPEPPADFTERLERGRALLVQGEQEQALNLLESLLADGGEVHPEAPRAHALAGEAALKLERHGQAEMHLDKAVLDDPTLWKAHAYLGMLCNQTGRFQEAETAFRQALAAKPGDPAALNNLGMTHMLMGRHAQAAEKFRQALVLSGPNERISNNLGLALASLGRDAEALEAFSVGGERARAYNNLGWHRYLRGEYGQAVSLFEQALSLEPTFYGKASANLERARVAVSFGEGSATANRNVLAMNGADTADTRQINHSMAPAPQSSMTSAPQSGEQDYEHFPRQSQPLSLSPSETQPITLRMADPDAQDKDGVHTRIPGSANKEQAPSKESSPAFAIHVASFRTLQRAEAMQARLAAHGETWAQEVNLGEKGTWIRVFTGGWRQRAQADDALRALRADGFDQARVVDSGFFTAQR